MKALIQRVSRASVEVDGRVVSEIGPGLLTLLGVCNGDTEAEADKLLQKICSLRIFEDDAGKMNRSLKDVQGDHLIVSQFTLAGDCRKGNRPSFTGAAPPDLAKALYEHAIEISQKNGISTLGGEFQAHMKVALVNDGPVTFHLDIAPSKAE